MSTSRYAGVCALVLAGSFAGSFLASRGVAPVHAQEATDLRGRSFTLVDQQGHTMASLRSGIAGAELVLSGNRGARIEIDGSGSISIHNLAGHLVWSAPPKGGVIPASE